LRLSCGIWKTTLPEAISNTSPLLYLYRIGALDWLPRLFSQVWTAEAVALELDEGKKRGHQVPTLRTFNWLKIASPHSVPSQWLALDLGAGELAILAMALENPEKVVLLDDALARRVAQAAGLQVWGTLRVVLEGKKAGLTDSVKPLIDDLTDSGMWVSSDVRARILALANET
jgi:predicted nucleic acid-binding protein